MLISLFEYMKRIGKVAAENSKYHIKEIKIFFSAPNPKQADDTHSLTIKDEAADDANFQWIAFQALFSTVNLKYYIYDMPLDTNGKEKPPGKVFESDDDWSGKNKDNPLKEVTTGDLKRAYPKIFRGPNLFSANQLPFGTPTNYINSHPTDKGKSYSSEEFKEKFDNDFYIVMDPTSKKLQNPFEDTVIPKQVTYPETPKKVEKE